MNIQEISRIRLFQFEERNLPKQPTIAVGYKLEEDLVHRINVFSEYLGINKTTLIEDCLWSSFPDIEKVLNDGQIKINGRLVSETLQETNVLTFKQPSQANQQDEAA